MFPKAPTVILLAIGAAALPSAVAAQATITRIVGRDGSALPSSDDVELIQFGSVQPIGIRRDVALGIGDELRSRSGQIVIVVSCSDTVSVTLVRQFRVAIMPPTGEKTCLLDLLAGQAHVQGDASTGLGAGGVTMGAVRTEYIVSVSRTGDGVRRDLTVFDGNVEVRSSGRADTNISAGTALSVERGGYRSAPITAGDIQAAAGLYAMVDASTLTADARRTATRSLFNAYQRVLTHPDSTAARLDLIGQQVLFDTKSRATFYQLKRVKVNATRTSQLDAATAALSVAAYTQVGDEQKASDRYEALRSYDAPAQQAALQSFRIDTAMVRQAGRLDLRANRNVLVRPALQALQVRAAADPPTIPVGGGTRIVVKVTTSSGTPVQASVRISAGGGAFAGVGGTEVDGLTNTDGVFSTVWSCRPCAAAGYTLSVKVAKQGFAPAEATVGVRVQPQ